MENSSTFFTSEGEITHFWEGCMNVSKIVRAMEAEGIISSANSTKMDISTFLGFSCLVALPLDNHSDAFFTLHVCVRGIVFFTARMLVSCSGLTTFLPPFSYTDVMTLACKMEASNSARQRARLSSAGFLYRRG